MAIFDAFLKLDGINGESADAKHKGEIDLVSFSWGATNPVSIGSATGGAGAGKLKFDDLRVVKKVDLSSPKLFQACATGQHISTGTIVVRKAGGVQLEYLKLNLNLIFIKDIQQQGTPQGDEIPLEEITMAIGSLQFQYQQQGSDGKAQGGPSIASWNVVTNNDNPTIPGL